MTHLLILNNKQCQIVSEDLALLKKLHNFLSYKPVGIEWTPAYMNSGWSGITYLLSKAGKFSYGLLPKVKKFLEDNNIIYTVEDRRTSKILVPELDISEALRKNNLVPRDHQVRILEAAMKTDHGIVRSATGSGKTLTTAMITAKINKPTFILVIGLDLLSQFHQLYSKLFQEKIGWVGNGICDIQRINIVSIWTLGRALKMSKNIIDEEDTENEKDLTELNQLKLTKALKEAKVIILDECHICQADTVKAITWNSDPEYFYSFSGTPYKGDGTDLATEALLGEQIINISASELIKLGLLAQPIIKFYTTPKMHGLGSGNYQTVYKDYIVENEIRNNMIIKISEELIEKKYTPLVLFKQIKHGEIILEKMENVGIKCAMLYGNDSLDKRNEVKEQLTNGEIDLIVASTIFDIGIDLVKLSALVLAGGGNSSVRCLQRVGRCLRPMPGKKQVAVVDFFDQAKYVKKHSMIRHGVYSSEDGFKVIKSKEMK